VRLFRFNYSRFWSFRRLWRKTPTKWIQQWFKKNDIKCSKFYTSSF